MTQKSNTKEILVKNFSGGISDDIRQESLSNFSITQHFDMFTSANKLVPYRDWVANDVGHVGIMNFLWDGTYLYGLGIKQAGGLCAQLYRKSSLIGDWQETPGGTSAPGFVSISPVTFILYKGFIYYWGLVNSLNRFEILTGTTTTGFKNLGTSNVAQGLVHSKSDNLYLPYNNIIAQMDGTVWTNVRLTLPSNCVITQLVEYGNFLAIYTRPIVSGVTTSKIYLWDMESDDVSDILDFGDGDLFIGGTAGGRLIGVMNEAISGTNTIPFSGVVFTPQKVFIKTYAGGPVTLYKTLSDDGIQSGFTYGLISTGRSVIQSNNGFSFVITSHGTKVPTGIYTISSVGENYPLAITCERNIFNDVSPVGDIGGIPLAGVLGIYKVGNMWFDSYNPVWKGGAGDLQNFSTNIGRTAETAAYTFPAFYESQLFNGGDPSNTYEVKGVAMFFEPLPPDGQVVMKYRVNNETEWRTIFIYSIDGQIAHEAINIEETGQNFEVWNQIQVRLESIGGATITGWKIEFNPLSGLLD